jgi:hypothetical protein
LATGYIAPASQVARRGVNDTDEYRSNYTANEYINRLYALDNGWTGAGVSVGVIDDGVNAMGDLAGAIDVARSRDFGFITVNGVTTQRNQLGSANSNHGTPVASIIAARRGAGNMLGIAPDAMIVVLRVEDYNADTDTETFNRMPEAFRYATSLNLQLINRSISGSGASTLMQSLVTDFGRNGGLLINSAGNDRAANPNEAFNVTDANRNTWLFVVALNPSGNGYALASYSNQCGTMMDRCVTAPGLNQSMGANPVTGEIAYGPFAGTSSAAPVVTGLAVLILQKWPQLSGQQAGLVIINTARDIGAPGIDPVFGAGIIDVQRALSPVNPSISLASQNSVKLDTDFTMLPGAFGNGGTVSGGGDVTSGKADSLASVFDGITIMDEYGRDFRGLSGALVSADAMRQRNMGRQLEAMGNVASTGFITPLLSASLSGTRYRTGFNQDSSNPEYASRLTSADVALRFGETSVRARFNGDDAIQNDILGLAPTSDVARVYAPGTRASLGVARPALGGQLTLSSQYANNSGVRGNVMMLGLDSGAFGLRAGYATERGGVFGTPTGNGAFRLADGSRSLFVEGNAGWSLGQVNFDAYAGYGWTRLRLAPDSVFTNVSTLGTLRWGLTGSTMVGRGRMMFGIAQPLTVMNGRATITTGTGYDLDTRSLLIGDRVANLGVGPRVQFTGGYELLSDRSVFRFGMTQTPQNGEVTALATFKKTF